jgi:hypothetical protein
MNESYRGHDRRRGNQVLENRITDLERDVTSLKGKVDTLEVDIKHNTDLTKAVKADTAELVLLLRSSKFVGRLIAWGAPIGAAAVAMLAYWRGEKF